jgi:hypothetical protein
MYTKYDIKILNKKKPAPRSCFYHVKERKRPNEKKYSEVKLMCQAGNLYRHCNVRVDANFVKLISVHPETASFGAVLTSDKFLDLD